MTEGKYFWNECKNNKRLVKCIYQPMTKNVHGIIDISTFITYVLNIFFGCSLDDQYIIYKIIT